MVVDGVRKSLRNTFRRKSQRQAGGASVVDGKKLLACKIALLDGSDVSINLQKDALGKDLLKRVYLHLDLVERDYFGLQFMDTKQIPHWLDPAKKVKKQVQIGPPYTFHFRVKFYAIEPAKLHEELTRYHFFMQMKQDVRMGKVHPTLKQSIDLGAFAVQSELGDFDNTLHTGNYVSEFRLVPNQGEELERLVEKKHRLLAGMNPAECENNYLSISSNLEYYGMDRHIVQGEDGSEHTIGLTPHGIIVMKGDRKLGFHIWKSITNITFKNTRFILCAKTQETETQEYRYVLPTPRASKHLWKCAIEYHTFFRLIKPADVPERKQSLLTFGSRFRYSGRTLHQAKKDDDVNARKSMMFKRTRSERHAQRSTIGYIRIGSNVWARAVNGDYYRGAVTALTDKVHVKFENGDTIAHDRADEDALVYDMDPNPNDIKIATRVIAHWSGVAAYLSGSITKIEGNKYHVLYDDGDRGTNRLEQMRILKPPLFFGPGSGRSKLQKKYSMKTTALIGSTSTTEGTKVSVNADISRPTRRIASDVGDDDAFLPDHRRQHSSPKLQPANQPPHVEQNTANQKWGADLTKGSSKRSHSASRESGGDGKKRNGTNSKRSNSADPAVRTKITNSKNNTQTPPLNARLVQNTKTGSSYQITDL